MLIRLVCIALLSIGLTSPVSAQVEMNYDVLNYMASREPDPNPDNRAEIKQRFQTYFIKQVFLNQMFKSDHLFYGEGSSADYDLVNQLMINEFADQLVESDFIDLSHVTLDE